MAGVNGVALAGLAAGGLFVFSGIKGKSITQALQYVIQGKNPSGAPQANPITDTSGGGDTGSGSPSAAAAGVIASKGGTSAANMAAGQLLAAGYGWIGNDWLCLKTGWQEESGWNQYAANVPSDPYNHAYGIPQANPGTKMASAGADWQTNPVTQIRWGLGYIKGTYGRPSQVPGWTPNGPAAGYVGY